MFQGEPDGIYISGKASFKFNSTHTKNIRLKWLAVCINFDYTTGSISLFLNGAKLEGNQRKNISLSEDAEQKALIVRIGKYDDDGTPLIGKIVDINIWDRWEKDGNIYDNFS